MTNRKPNGYLLHENAMYVVIATMATNNPKTGDMVQIWILPRNTSPVDAVRSGEDDVVCFDCKHRGIDGKNRTCYVKVFQAPTAVWKAYRRGSYPTLAIEDYKYTFSGRKIRLGAYGEPVLIPMHILSELTIYSDGWTGYTHQWANPEYAPYGAYLMASVDSVREYEHAKSLGWRTFRVRTSDGALMEREIVCPASDEANHRTTCADCRLCAGSYAGDPRKDIAIIVHGSSAKKFIQIARQDSELPDLRNRIVAAITSGIRSGGDVTDWDAPEFTEAVLLTTGIVWDFAGWRETRHTVEFSGILGGVDLR